MKNNEGRGGERRLFERRGLNTGFMLYEKGKKKDTRKEGGNVDKSATEVTAPWQCGTRFWTKQKIPHPLSTLLDA